MYYAFSKTERFVILKEKAIAFGYEYKNISEKTIENVFIILDKIQAYQDCYTDIHYEEDGGVTISLENNNNYIMDIFTHEVMNILWVEKDGDEVFYKEKIPLNTVFRYIKSFNKEEF